MANIFGPYEPTYLNVTRPEPTTDFNINPAFGLTGAGRLDPMGSDMDYFLNLPGSQRFGFGFRDSNIPGSPNYEAPSQFFQEPSFIDKGIASIKKAFAPRRFKGELGDRLLAQSQGIASKIPSIFGSLAFMRSPFNPNSPTFNAALPMQLNFLEANTGTRVTGTSDNLKLTDDLALIGRDPKTGGLKYGPGSVLFGKNVISGFGTNDYETALNDYIAKMTARGNLSTFQKAKLRQAQIELDNLLADQKKEFDKPGGTREQVRDLQARIDAGEFDSTSDKPDRDPSSVTKESAAKTPGVGGGGYTKSDSVRESRRGGQYGFKKGGLAGILGY